MRRYYVGAGFCSGGIAAAGGAGRALAEWIVDDRPPMDLWQADIRRFAPFHADPRFLRERVSEIVGVHYNIAFPNRELTSGRGVRRSPLHERLRARRAAFGAKMGWERANWFAPEGVEPETVYSFGRQNWFPYAAAEHRAAREAVAIFDQTSFAKLLRAGGGRGGGSPAAVRQRRGRAAGPHRVHRHAERAGRLRERPHGHPAGRGRLPGRHRIGPEHARPRLDPAPPARRRAGHGHRRDRRVGGARGDGPALARAAARA